MTNNPSENIWDEFKKISKIGPSMESLNAVFFFFSFLPKLSKFLFWVATMWLGRWDTLTLNHKSCILRARELYNKNIYVW